jgi:hypothetical protein
LLSVQGQEQEQGQQLQGLGVVALMALAEWAELGDARSPEVDFDLVVEADLDILI